VLAVGHDRDEIADFRHCSEVVSSPPAVLEEPVIGGRAGFVAGSMHDCRADREAGGVKRICRVRIPLSKSLAIRDVQILDVELNSPVSVCLAEIDHRLDGARARKGIREQPPQSGPVESFVREKRHHLHIVPFREVEYALVDAPHMMPRLSTTYDWGATTVIWPMFLRDFDSCLRGQRSRTIARIVLALTGESLIRQALPQRQ
jgi:hypothetical protein